MSNDKTLKSFNKWLLEPAQRVKLHQAVQVRQHTTEPGYGVFSTASIPQDEIIFSIPKSCILSIRTCAISNLLEISEIDGMLGICLAYLYERSLGASSPWHPYIAICPKDVPISKLWSKEEQLILKGSEVAMVGGITLSDFKDMYKSEVLRFLRRNTSELRSFSQLDFAEFCHGMSVVGSRAFEIDVYHGLAMCPFADMLDHGTSEHVHFHTNYDVCPDCGESYGCEHETSDSEPAAEENIRGHTNHDREDIGLSDDSSETSSSLDDDLCEFLVCRSPRANEQIMNTYGNCGNDVLLARYGFALLDNPHDRISLGPELANVPDSLDYRSWWETNGRNLMLALQKEAKHDRSQANDDDITSNEDDETELDDLCFLEYSGRPSLTLLHYLLLCTISPGTLQSKSGPEIKAHFEVLLAAYQYVQPGRMPLPKYLFKDALHNILTLVVLLQRAIFQRLQRYKTHQETFKIDMNDVSIAQLVKSISAMKGLTPQQSRLRYATIVRINELKIMQRGSQYLESLENACHWLLERDMVHYH